MPAVFNEDTQFVSDGGIPLVGGKIYIGDVDQDPVANPKSIFSDREFTSALANPQTIDATGRSTNKIWVDGKYSLQINDINGAQVFQDLDRGANSTSLGIVNLSSVIGGNTITAVASPVITSYTDKLFYIFTAAQTNTGAATLNIDSIGAKAIVQNNGLALGAGRIRTDDNVVVCYNATNDNFAIVNQKTNLIGYRATAVGDNVDPEDLGFVIDCTAALTLTTTAAATLGAGCSFYVKANGGTVTIDPNGTETIDGDLTALVPNGTKVLVTCDGTNFHMSMASPVFAKGADVATATEALVLMDGKQFLFTGTTDVETIEDTADAFPIWSTIIVEADGVFDWINSSSLKCIGNADVTTQAGDWVQLQKYASGSWRMQFYQRADGSSVVATPTGWEYSSADTTLSIGSSTTFTHGLGAAPSQVQLDLKCILAAGGYTAGDVIKNLQSANTGVTPTQIMIDNGSTTQVRVLIPITNFRIIDKGTRNVFDMTAADFSNNFRFIVRAKI